jgi:predicted DNA-binding protein
MPDKSKPKRKTRLITIRLRPELYTVVEKVAAEDRRSLSFVVRELVEKLAAEHAES